MIMPNPKALAQFAACTLFAALIAGCGTTGGEDLTYTPAPPEPKQLGKIAFVDNAEGFVLVRLTYGLSVDVGVTLYSLDAEGRATARLERAAGEKKKFIVANIMSGSPQMDDQVYVFPDPATAPGI